MATKDQHSHPEPHPHSPSPHLSRKGAGGEQTERPALVPGTDKPIPVPTLETAPYWEGCRQHQLRIQRCANCRQYQFFPRIYCSKCFSEQVQWVNASGRAKILSFTVVRRPVSPAFANEVPYIVALVTLEEGPQMMTNIVGCSPEEVAIGMPVEVIFEDWSDTISIPKFRPRRG